MKEIILMGILKVIIFCCILVLFLVVWFSLSKRIKEKKIRESGEEMLGYAPRIIDEIIIGGILVIGILVAFYVIGVDVGFLIFGLSFGIAYASKTAIRNVLSGIMILSNKEFKLGDLIEFMYDKHKIYFGRIEEVTLRYTIIRKLDRRKTIIPNYLLTSLPIVTYSSEGTVRLKTRVNVVLKTDIEICKQHILEVVNLLDFVLEKEFTLVEVEQIGVKWITFLVYFYIDPNAGRMRFKAVSDVNKEIAKALKDQHIEFSYPHTVMTLESLTPHDRLMGEQLHKNISA